MKTTFHFVGWNFLIAAIRSLSWLFINLICTNQLIYVVKTGTSEWDGVYSSDSEYDDSEGES